MHIVSTCRVQSFVMIWFSAQHTIVNRGNSLWIPVNNKAANRKAKIKVGRSTTVHTFCFSLHFAWITWSQCFYWLLFLLVTCMNTPNSICILLGFVHGQPPTKTYNKELCRVSKPFPSINYNTRMAMKMRTWSHVANSEKLEREGERGRGRRRRRNGSNTSFHLPSYSNELKLQMCSTCMFKSTFCESNLFSYE